MSSTSLPIETPVRPVDQLILDLLRREEGLGVPDFMERLEVTATAIRQRLDRLEEAGYIERKKQSAGRGRPSFQYFLTDMGWRQAGVTYGDFAISMWSEICAIRDEQLKSALIDAISHRMGCKFREHMPDAPLIERMKHIVSMLSHRKIPSCIAEESDEPVLEVQACPYPDLVGIGVQDRSVCALETKVISEALGHDVELSKCRLDGHSCCQFKPTTLTLTKNP